MERWFKDDHRATDVLDFTTCSANLQIDFTTSGHVILDIEDATQRLKLTLHRAALLEVCIAQLTMLQGG